MKQFFTSKFLFQVNSVMLEKSDKIFFVIGVALVLLAVVLKLSAVFAPSPVDRKVRNRLFHVFLTIGLCEAVWFAARWENIAFFGSHFMALLILLVGLVWFGFVAKYFFAGYRQDRVGYEKEQTKLKYLPKQ